MASNVRTIFANMSWLMVSQILTSVCAFVWTILSARYLGPSEYGTTSKRRLPDVDISDVMSVKFSLNFIKQMLDFKKISKEVEMELGGNALVYKFEDEIMGVTVRGLIAARIEED